MLPHSASHLQFVAPKATIYKYPNPMFGQKSFTSFDGIEKPASAIEQFGTPECVAFRDKILSKYRDLSSAIRAEYEHIATTSSYVEANRRLLELDKRLHVSDFNLTANEEDIIALSKSLASKSKDFRSKFDDSDAIRLCLELADRYQLDFSSLVTRVKNTSSLLNRFEDPTVWKRKLSALCRSELQAVTRELRQVHKFFSPYSSKISAKRYKTRKTKTEEYLSNTVLENELGYSLTLLDAVSRNPSNPYIRFVELRNL